MVEEVADGGGEVHGEEGRGEAGGGEGGGECGRREEEIRTKIGISGKEWKLGLRKILDLQFCFSEKLYVILNYLEVSVPPASYRSMTGVVTSSPSSTTASSSSVSSSVPSRIRPGVTSGEDA